MNFDKLRGLELNSEFWGRIRFINEKPKEVDITIALNQHLPDEVTEKLSHFVHYSIKGYDLVEACEFYTPSGILVWIPYLNSFGTWDSDHNDAWYFPGLTIDTICQNPLLYVDCLWLDPETYAFPLIPNKDFSLVTVPSDVVETIHGKTYVNGEEIVF